MTLREALDELRQRYEKLIPEVRERTSVRGWRGDTDYYIKILEKEYGDSQVGYLLQVMKRGKRISIDYFENIEALELSLLLEHLKRIDIAWHCVSVSRFD